MEDPPLSSSGGNETRAALASPVTGSSRSDGGAFDVNMTDGNITGMNEAMVKNSPRRSAFDFAEEIRRLEVEGEKLRTATINSLQNNAGQTMNGYRDGIQSSFEIGYTAIPNISPLSPVYDISKEQKTITDLRIQLENQRKETARLQTQLLGDISNGVRSNASMNNVSYPFDTNAICSSTPNNTARSSSPAFSPLSFPNPSRSVPAFSTIPNGEIGSSLIRRPVENEPPCHLERSLKESQEQVMELKKRLQEAHDVMDQQKKQFRMSIEELKSKLHETVTNRDTMLNLRQKESSQQDILLEKLQSSLNHLQEQYKMQEEALVAASRKLDSQTQHHYAHETTVNQIRSILIDRERRKGSSFFESDPATSQSVSMLPHTLERCFQELDHDTNVTKYKVSGLESDLEQLKKTSQEKERKSAQDLESRVKAEEDEALRRVSVLTAEHEKNMSIASEQIRITKQQLVEFQSQIYDKESQYALERQEKQSRIQDLEDRIEEHNKLILEERTRWQEKRLALESSMDEIQRELVETKAEKNDFIQKHTCLESQLTDLQSLVSRLETDLSMERDRVREQRCREEDLRTQSLNLETQLSHKQSDIERLEKMVDVVKQDCSLLVVDKIASVERLERDRYLDQIKSLSAQLATMTEKSNRAAVDYQMAKSEMESLRSQVIDLTEKIDKARSQVEGALMEKNELTSLLGNKTGDLDRLIRDKEHFSQLAEERAMELRELKLTETRLTQQLEEKEKVLSAFSQQSSSINQLMEVHSKSNDNIREEKDKLTSALDQKSVQYEDLKSSLEVTSRKLKSKEKRARDLEEERLKLNEELVVKSQELDLMQQEKDGLLSELKESRLEVAGLSTSKDTLKKELLRLKNLRTKEINKLQTKLKESEQENRLSQKALRSKDIIDQKAVRFADKAQRQVTIKRSEVDVLASKLHRLEEKLQTVIQEKTMVEKDKESLKKSLAKSLLHTQELTDELRTTQTQNQELIRKVADYEMAMEKACLKANLKTSTTTAQLEKCEQEMAMVKIKHQLDLKEAERQFVRGAQTGFYNHGSSGACSLPSMLPERDLNPQSSISTKHHKVGGQTPRDNDSSSVVTVSDAGSDGINTLDIRDKKHREYTEVGRDLKNLLSDMRNLISSHRESEEEDGITFQSSLKTPTRLTVDKNRIDTERSHVNSKANKNLPVNVQDLRLSPDNLRDFSPHRQRDFDKSWASKSYSELDTLSDFSAYKDWRPRSRSLTRNKSWASDLDLDSTQNFSTTMSDMSHLSQSVGSHKKDYTDTRELCRRLEDKINSLTGMGRNLQKENREMANLIDRQGEKLDTVKKNERKARGQIR